MQVSLVNERVFVYSRYNSMFAQITPFAPARKRYYVFMLTVQSIFIADGHPFGCRKMCEST